MRGTAARHAGAARAKLARQGLPPTPPPTTPPSPAYLARASVEATPALPRRAHAAARARSAALRREPAPGGRPLRSAGAAARLAASSCSGKELELQQPARPRRRLAAASASSTSRPSAIIKHTNPCGWPSAATLAAAYRKALACDPVSAFGGIIAFNRTARRGDGRGDRPELFVEVIVAPDYTPEALAMLAAQEEPARCHGRGDARAADGACVIESVGGGLLAADARRCRLDRPQAAGGHQRAAHRATSGPALEFAWQVAKHVKSNAIVLARATATVGVGAGQMSRVDSADAGGAARPASRAEGAVLASDAFFPFPDGVEAAAEAGVTAVIQPGGSIRDEEVDRRRRPAGLAMVFTGVRHFRH